MPVTEAVVTTVRIPAHVHKVVTEMAKLHHRSVNAQIVVAIENDIAKGRFDKKMKGNYTGGKD